MVLTPIQPKIQASKVSEFAPSCANEYVKEKEKEEEKKEKEKEKNTTIFTKNHGKVLATTSDYLLHDILV